MQPPSFYIYTHNSLFFAIFTNLSKTRSDFPTPNSRESDHLGENLLPAGAQVGSSRSPVVDGGGLLALVNFTHLHRLAQAATAKTVFWCGVLCE
jgi:hypothetical protein